MRQTGGGEKVEDCGEGGLARQCTGVHGDGGEDDDEGGTGSNNGDTARGQRDRRNGGSRS